MTEPKESPINAFDANAFAAILTLLSLKDIQDIPNALPRRYLPVALLRHRSRQERSVMRR
jgi:hypothetical protein